MKLILFTLSLIACAALAEHGGAPSQEYLPPVASAPAAAASAPAPAIAQSGSISAAPSGLSGLDIQQIPLVAEYHSSSASEPEPAHALAEDGYRYKTHRAKKYRFRNRRRRVRVQ